MKLLSIFYVLFLVNFSLYAEVDKVKQKKLIYALENDIIKFSDLPPQKIVKYDISKYLHDGSANSAEVLRVNRRDIYNITITPDGKYALISDHNTKGDYVTLKIDIKTKKVVKTFHENFSNIDISSDGNYLLTSNSDGVKLWNLKSGKLIKTIKTSSYGYISSISINSNGKYAITTHDGSRIVKYWNLKTGKLINSFSLKNSYIYSSEIAPDGKSMVAYVYSSVKYNSSVNSYNLDTKKLIKNIYNCKCRRETAGISPNLKQMYIVDHKKVDFINLKTSEVRSMKGQSGSTYTSLSSNGKFVINYNKKSIGIWNLDENKEHHTINMPVEKLKFDKAAIDPKGKFILFVDNTKNKMYKINISHINSLGIKEQKATNKKIKEYILTKGYIDYPENSISLIKALDGAIGETYEFEREMAENNFKKYNFRIRKSLKNAIIGSRHVPHTSTSYTNYDYDTTYVNGKAFHVTSKNTENYSSGGHSENVYGYQVIYEFKNQSKNYYLIELESKWTGYYTSYNTASYGAWSSKSGTYLTSNTKGSPSSYPYAFAIAPGEKVKYQFEAGENKPKNLVTKIVTIH
ncbi:MAG: WD40 repeat domain-containing protein, partial [Campylobacterota bacterium]|nr:WD40 repeat domain-containing protein [Campylobacterota bacterium]